MKIKHIIISALMLMSVSFVSAQKLLYDLKFDARFDNREYKSNINSDQTLFGARLTPKLGIGWGDGNSLMIGTDLMADFGAPPFNTKPDWIAYYGFESREFKAYAGVFPRDKMRGTYSTAFFSDSVKYYDSNLEGMLLQYKGRRGYIEFGCDWNSMISSTSNEKFMLFSSGQFDFNIFNLGYNLSMYHHAGTTEVSGVVDNILLNPYAGIDLKALMIADKLYLRAGWLQGLQNDREYVGGYVKPNGALIELGIEKWNFGIYNAAYIGDDLMPYYSQYGNGLYMGDPFFRTEHGVYNRLEIYWNPIKRRDMNLYVASAHHYDGKKWGWQQIVQLTVRIDEGMFRKKYRR